VAILSDHEVRTLRLNNATEEDLAALPRVGPKRASALVWHRPFKSWEELTEVPCLGKRTIKNLQSCGVTID